MLDRYEIDIYYNNKLLYFGYETSITKVAKLLDKFICDDDLFSIEIFDCVKDISVEHKELMRIWHG